MSKNIWVFCEQRDGELQSVALELLGVARELAAKTGEKVGALLLGAIAAAIRVTSINAMKLMKVEG